MKDTLLKVIDISWPISTATTGYKDKKIVSFDAVKHMANDGVRETTIHLSAHTGTHVDAPSHFLQDGKTIDQIQLERLIGTCKVLDMTNVTDGITREDLRDCDIVAGDIIVLKTTNSDQSPTVPFTPHFIYLTQDGADYLVKKEIKAVGIDYLGIERSQVGHPTHTTLMHGDVVVIEGLRLGHVQPGIYNFVCLPLNVIGLEAAPARAILMYEL